MPVAGSRILAATNDRVLVGTPTTGSGTSTPVVPDPLPSAALDNEASAQARAQALALAVQDTRRRLREAEAREEQRRLRTTSIPAHANDEHDRHGSSEPHHPMRHSRKPPSVPSTPGTRAQAQELARERQAGASNSSSLSVPPGRSSTPTRLGAPVPSMSTSGTAHAQDTRGPDPRRSHTPLSSSRIPRSRHSAPSVATDSSIGHAHERVRSKTMSAAHGGAQSTNQTGQDRGGAENSQDANHDNDDDVVNQVQLEIELEAQRAIEDLQASLDEQLRAADEERRRHEKRASAAVQSLRRARLDAAKTDRQLQAEASEAKAELVVAEQRANARVKATRDTAERSDASIEAARLEVCKAEEDACRSEQEASEQLATLSAAKAAEVDELTKVGAQGNEALDHLRQRLQCINEEKLEYARHQEHFAASVVDAEHSLEALLLTELRAGFDAEGVPSDQSVARHEVDAWREDREDPATRSRRLRQLGGPAALFKRVSVASCAGPCRSLSKNLVEQREQVSLLEAGLHRGRTLLQRSEAVLHGFRDAWRVSTEAADGKLLSELNDLQHEVAVARERLQDMHNAHTAALAAARMSEEAAAKRQRLSAEVEAVKEEIAEHRSLSSKLCLEFSAAAASSGAHENAGTLVDFLSAGSQAADSSPTSSMALPWPSSQRASSPSSSSKLAGAPTQCVWPSKSEAAEDSIGSISGVQSAVCDHVSSTETASDLASGRIREPRRNFPADEAISRLGESDPEYVSALAFSITDDTESWVDAENRAQALEDEIKADLCRIQSEHGEEKRDLKVQAAQMSRSCYDTAIALWRTRGARCRNEQEYWHLRTAMEVERLAGPNWSSSLAAGRAVCQRLENQALLCDASAEKLEESKNKLHPTSVDDIAFISTGDDFSVPMDTSDAYVLPDRCPEALSLVSLPVSVARLSAMLTALHDDVETIRCRKTAATKICQRGQDEVVESELISTALCNLLEATLLHTPNNTLQAIEETEGCGTERYQLNVFEALLQNFQDAAVASRALGEDILREQVQEELDVQSAWEQSTEVLQTEIKAAHAGYVESLVALDANLDLERGLEEELQRGVADCSYWKRHEQNEEETQAALASRATRHSTLGRELEDVYATRAHHVESLHHRHEVSLSELRILQDSLAAEREFISAAKAHVDETRNSNAMELRAQEADIAKHSNLIRALEHETEAAKATAAHFNFGLGLLWDERRLCNRASRSRARVSKEQRELLDELLVAHEERALSWKQLNACEASCVELIGELGDRAAHAESGVRQAEPTSPDDGRPRSRSPGGKTVRFSGPLGAEGRVACDDEPLSSEQQQMRAVAESIVAATRRLAASRHQAQAASETRIQSLRALGQAEAEVADLAGRLRGVHMHCFDMTEGLHEAARSMGEARQEHRMAELELCSFLSEAKTPSQRVEASSDSLQRSRWHKIRQEADARVELLKQRIADARGTAQKGFDQQKRLTEEVRGLEARLPVVLSDCSHAQGDLQAWRNSVPTNAAISSVSRVGDDNADQAHRVAQMTGICPNSLRELRDVQLQQLDELTASEEVSCCHALRLLEAYSSEFEAVQQRLSDTAQFSGSVLVEASVARESSVADVHGLAGGRGISQAGTFDGSVAATSKLMNEAYSAILDQQARLRATLHERDEARQALLEVLSQHDAAGA